MTQDHLMDLYGTCSCRVVHKSKARSPISLHWIAYEIRLVLLKSSCWPLSANCLYLCMKLRGTWVNNTHTTTIFLERGMFSASFNTKMNVVQWIVWFLHTIKEMLCVRYGVLFELQKNEFENQAARLNWIFSAFEELSSRVIQEIRKLNQWCSTASTNLQLASKSGSGGAGEGFYWRALMLISLENKFL